MAVYLIERNSHDKIRDELIKIAQQYEKAKDLPRFRSTADKLIKRWNDLGMKGEPNLDYAKSLGNEDSSLLVIKGDTVVGVRNRDVTSIKIPDGIKKIGDNAFLSCTSLKSITIPDSVTYIGWEAFHKCYSLKNIKIPNSVTYIGDFAFWDCTSLTSITIPDFVTEIGSGAFRDCTNLRSITIPDSVTYISSWTFVGCTSLKSITIPDSVTEIWREAFSRCTSLINVKFEGDPSKIEFGYNVFKNTPYEKEFNKLMKSKGVD